MTNAGRSTYGKCSRGSEARVGGVAILALAGVAVAAGSCQGPQPFFRNQEPELISCSFTRPECEMETAQLQCDPTGWDTGHVSTPLTGVTCYDPSKDGSMTDKCNAVFCGSGQSRDGFNDTIDGFTCKVLSAADALDDDKKTVISGVGVCKVESSATRLALVEWSTYGRVCEHFEESNSNPQCDALTVVTSSGTGCFQTSQPIINEINPYPFGTPLPPADQDGIVNITNVVLDSPSCNSLTIAVGALTYAVTPGTVATASGGGVTAPISASGGLVSVSQNCSNDVFGCQPTSIDKLQLNVANMTVAGAQLTNVAISNASPAPVTATFVSGKPLSFSVAAGALTLAVNGYFNGVQSFFTTANSAPLQVQATSSGFNLSGPLTVTGVDAFGNPLPVTITTNLSGTPATAQQTACGSQTGIQRLFGFEDVLSWSSSQATLSPVTTPVTQGCGALGIAGQGYMTISSDQFATSGLTLAPALSVDLFIPGNQPNQFYLGALQMYLTCPSANVFNAYIGQDELTGKPQNAYSTFRYPLPSNVTSTLQQKLSDCSLSFALNVNQTGRPGFSTTCASRSSRAFAEGGGEPRGREVRCGVRCRLLFFVIGRRS